MISKARNALFAVALFAIGASANAVPIVDGNVDSRSVDYIYFSTGGGALQIDVFGTGGLANELIDPMIRLFRGSLSAANHVAGNNNGGPGLNARLTFGGGLAAGNYVLAVGAFFMTINEAVTGNASTPIGNNNQYRAIFRGDAAAVPEPSTLALLGLGLLGLVAVRKK